MACRGLVFARPVRARNARQRVGDATSLPWQGLAARVDGCDCRSPPDPRHRLEHRHIARSHSRRRRRDGRRRPRDRRQRSHRADDGFGRGKRGSSRGRRSRLGLAFIATLFAIHMGRMVPMTILGFVAPAVAVLGDMVIAMLITLFIINPMYLLWRWPTRWIERRLWRRYLGEHRRRASGRWRGSPRRGSDFDCGLRSACGRRATPFAPRSTRRCRRGCPLPRIIAATVPVWGMSWYFDTENWAAGIWNSWAESRTDTWREAMVRAVLAERSAGTSRADRLPSSRRVSSRGLLVHRDRRHRAKGTPRSTSSATSCSQSPTAPDVRFVVISSDVVYPTGSMNDYEAKFWLPFKGVTRAGVRHSGQPRLVRCARGFCRDFPPARRRARARMRARVEADLRVTSTTEDRIDELDRRSGLASSQPTTCRRDFSARRSSSCRPTDLRSSPSTPACSGRSTRCSGVARGRPRPRRGQVDDGHPRTSVLSPAAMTRPAATRTSRASNGSCSNGRVASSWLATHTTSSTT